MRVQPVDMFLRAIKTLKLIIRATATNKYAC